MIDNNAPLLAAVEERGCRIATEPAMWGTPNGGRPERYGRTFGYADSQLQRTNIRRSVAQARADGEPTARDSKRGYRHFDGALDGRVGAPTGRVNSDIAPSTSGVARNGASWANSMPSSRA